MKYRLFGYRFWIGLGVQYGFGLRLEIVLGYGFGNGWLKLRSMFGLGTGFRLWTD
jgi:hypothetical protein